MRLRLASGVHAASRLAMTWQRRVSVSPTEGAMAIGARAISTSWAANSATFVGLKNKWCYLTFNNSKLWMTEGACTGQLGLPRHLRADAVN